MPSSLPLLPRLSFEAAPSFPFRCENLVLHEFDFLLYSSMIAEERFVFLWFLKEIGVFFSWFFWYFLGGFGVHVGVLSSLSCRSHSCHSWFLWPEGFRIDELSFKFLAIAEDDEEEAGDSDVWETRVQNERGRRGDGERAEAAGVQARYTILCLSELPVLVVAFIHESSICTYPIVQQSCPIR